jgi:predicted enzyme related to lactoylglutathione lyase
MFRVIHFEIHAENPERAINFYQNVFGWTFAQWPESEDYWLINTGEGTRINGAIIRRRGPAPIAGAPMNGFVNTIQVKDIDETITKITQHNGTIAVPLMDIPNVGKLAYFSDTEGNVFGATQPYRL